MKKFVKRLNEFLPQSMQMNNPTTTPGIKPGTPTKPGKPSPIPGQKPSVTPKPQASSMDVYNHFIDTLRDLNTDFEFDLGYLMQKYESGTTTKPTTKPGTPTRPGAPSPIPGQKPSVTPKPQAYSQFESFSLKSFGQFVNEARHEENPAFSDDYKSRFPERIGREAEETNRRVMGRNIPPNMMAIVTELLSLQRGHERELEKLAYDLIMDQYGSILEYVKLEIRFPKDKDEAKKRCESCAPKPPKQEIKDRRVIAEINRRKVGKMVMQAEAKASKKILNLASDGLAEILGEEDAIRYRTLLNQVGDIAHIADLLTPEDVMLGFWTRNNPAGMVDVSWEKDEDKDEEECRSCAIDVLTDLENDNEPDEDDLEELFSDSSKPKILAIGNDFAMLLHEAIKGIWQLIISAAIPEDVNIATQVIENTDTMADEIEDLKFGPFIAEDIDAFIRNRYRDKVESIENFKERLFGKMITESNPMTFLKMIRAILMEDYSPKGMTKLDQLAQAVEDEMMEYREQMRDYEEQMRDYKIQTRDAELMGGIGRREEMSEKPNDLDYSTMSQREIQNLIDSALDAGDMETVRMLAKYLKEGFDFDLLY